MGLKKIKLQNKDDGSQRKTWLDGENQTLIVGSWLKNIKFKYYVVNQQSRIIMR